MSRRAPGLLLAWLLVALGSCGFPVRPGQDAGVDGGHDAGQVGDAGPGDASSTEQPDAATDSGSPVPSDGGPDDAGFDAGPGDFDGGPSDPDGGWAACGTYDGGPTPLLTVVPDGGSFSFCDGAPAQGSCAPGFTCVQFAGGESFCLQGGCQNDADCGNGGVCVDGPDKQGINVCLVGCLSSSQCPAGTACSWAPPAGPPVCVPDCRNQWPTYCAAYGGSSQFVCDQTTGGCTIMLCDSSADCPSGMVCHTDETTAPPQQYCMQSCAGLPPSYCCNVTTQGAVCDGSSGDCVTQCGSGESFCGGMCTDESTDSSNCGACGKQCPAGAPCQNGSCACGAGLSVCGDACVDESSDSNNCGSCGKACGAPDACVNGECACSSAETLCSGLCVDESTDVDNCGSCGRQCGSGGSCISGGCVCMTGASMCSGECVDESTDVNNCDHCGAMCAAGADDCILGQCVPDYGWALWPAPPDAPAPSNYSIAADSLTVQDLVSGLVWQRTVTPLQLYDFENAGSYCATLNLGGFSSGWRLPTVIELMSIADFSSLNLTINATVFPNTPHHWFWTSQLDVSDAMRAWRVRFDIGSPGVDTTTMMDDGNVRCVHSG